MKLEQYQLAKQYKPIPIHLGISLLDKDGGFASDDFLVIAGATGSMKSYLAMWMALNAAKSGKRVLFINAEMLSSEFVRRIEFLGFDFENDFGAFNERGHNRFMVMHAENLNDNIKYEQVERWVSILKPDLLVVDLFSCLIPAEGHIPTESLKIAQAFSFYPRKYSCAVICTEQLIKENLKSDRPTENSISQGKSLSNKATKIITLYSYYRANPDKYISNYNKVVDRTLEMIIKKDRSSRVKLGIGLLFVDNGFRDLDTQASFNGEQSEREQYMSLVFRSNNK